MTLALSRTTVNEYDCKMPEGSSLTSSQEPEATTGSPGNVDVAMEWIAAMTGFDSGGLRRTMAPHLKYHLARTAARMARERNAPGAPADKPDPYVYPRDEYIAQHEHARRMIFVKPEPPEVVRVAAGGDDVVLLTRIRSPLKNGETYDNLYSYHLRFEGGLIAEVWELFDTAYALSVYPS
ncbi:hypothetical protein M6B22_06865 [Jatrophihabitans cynanchi]|uniref:SnoaL-like domain-containing protein n=1 Tax=Jatrophihabitans cynanchi TaxID=2944128 RepID=A0ABY7K0V0_9ACTN|nr:hypothetical protein [Jatrophihabitans sp. SB3-54]WAX58479.1 hypothetical protein M6B22_06865 [Jatrophihabitans sp. SB3-54]